MGKGTQTLDRGALPRMPASWSRLFTIDFETGVLLYGQFLQPHSLVFSLTYTVNLI
jgi:hypothetical protein